MANSSETATFPNLNNKTEDLFKVHKTDFKPCLKHAAKIIIESPPIEKPSKQFCENCSQTMLSYIFLIQDALDNLARKIYDGENKNCCLQCLRQELRTKFNTPHNTESIDNTSKLQTEAPNESPLQSSNDTTNVQKEHIPGMPVSENNAPKPARKSSIRRNSRRLSREQTENENMNSKASPSNENGVDKQSWKTIFLYDLSPIYNVNSQTLRCESNDFTKNVVIKVNTESCTNEPVVGCQEKNILEDTKFSNDNSTEAILASSENKNVFSDGETKSQNITKPLLVDTHQIAWNDTPLLLNQQSNELDNDCVKNNFAHEETLLLGQSNCEFTKSDIKSLENSTIVNEKNFILDYGQSPTKPQHSSEAFVTICRNNAEVLGCLVLGCSLQLCRSSKTLCVLVLEEVDTKFRAMLSSVFNVVETVSSLNSANSTIPTRMKYFLAKLNIWRLLNFRKCVFLNPDTLVIRNCDELFQWEELSAVPDTGWPDCFNTGVFVFVPSLEKFSELVEFTKKQEHDSDGEEMVLNSFFDSWTRDISKKLSFIYNLVDNASYTYAPAFQRFGHNVKIVQFTGSLKPWQVKFCNQTHQIHEVASTQPNFISFFYEWINIFRVAVLRLLSQDINSKVLCQNIIAAEDILQFIEPDAKHEIPNFISHSNHRNFKIVESKIKSSENEKEICTVSTKLQTAKQEVEHALYNKLLKIAHSASNLIPSIGIVPSTQIGQCILDGAEKSVLLNDISEGTLGYDRKNIDLPGSVVGDYQGMKMWEQGQMDYAGCDNSENIIKRLQFLMDQPQCKVSGISADTKIIIN